ncbi:unnamed protein product, partial [Discosporangium mesarthrocarpum]
DYNATTPIYPEVSLAMLPYLGQCFGNPSSMHAVGRPCRVVVGAARKRVAALLGCGVDEVLFVSCGTEADNHAIQGAVGVFRAGLGGHGGSPSSSTSGSGPSSGPSSGPDGAPGSPRKAHIVSSVVEHPAVTRCLDSLASQGLAEVTYVGVDSLGRVSVVDVEAAMRPDTALVTIMHSNNEVGTLQPVREIASLCRERGVLCHTDAAQSIGKVRVKVSELGVDMLTLVGHKFGAPKGVAALFVRRGVEIMPFLWGGGQEAGRRGGTENVILIAGLGKAAEV